ncbi:MAG: hypothetical protein HY898_30620 [Deltaproteobacteria bacterium]|nr:hypothetical protein [Deltaproteobacteria bacterium]
MDRWAWLRLKVEQLFSLAAILVPAFAAMGRVAVDSAWCDDMPTVRGLGLVSIGAPASLSTVAMQLASLIPIGPMSYRLAIGSALALGLCAALIQKLARMVLEAHVPGSFLNAPLAAIAALTAALGPALQREATIGAGSTFTMAAALAALVALAWRGRPVTTRWLLMALALAGVVCESMIAAGATALGIAVLAGLTRDVPDRRGRQIVAATFLATAIVLALPAVLRPSAPHVWLNLGRSLSTQGLVALDTLARRTSALTAWRNEVGTISLALAGLGSVIGLVRKRTRALVLPCVVFIAADAIFPATTGAVLSSDPLTPLRMLAVAAVAIAAALGVQTAATTLIDMGLPMARAGAALLVMFNLTLVAVASEQSAFTVDRTDFHGSAVFTDEGLEKLESESMVLVRSHALAWRLLSARVVAGARPDVLVVPIPLLHRGQVAATLMAAEPAVSLLLRDVAISGTPGEHAVSQLADKRTLYVELDPTWNAKVANHLIPDGLWLRLAPQPGGAPDRKLAIAAAGKPFDKLAASIRVGEDRDRATGAVLLASARQQAVASAMVGDKKATRLVLDRIVTFDENDLFVRDMAQRLEHSKGNQIDVHGLLP